MMKSISYTKHGLLLETRVLFAAQFFWKNVIIRNWRHVCNRRSICCNPIIDVYISSSIQCIRLLLSL